MLYRNLTENTLTVESAVGPLRVVPGGEVAIAPKAAQPYLDSGALELIPPEKAKPSTKKTATAKEAD
jgi:hypothetical protein